MRSLFGLIISLLVFSAYGRIVDPLLKQKSDDLKIKPAITKQGLPAADKPETEKQEKSLFRPSVPKTPLDKAPIPKQFAVAKPVVPPKSSEYNFTLTEDLNSNSTNQPDSPDGHLVCVYQSDDGHSVCFYQSDDGLDRFAVIERMHNEITGCQLFGNRESVEHVLIRNHISEVANLTSAEFSALVNDCDRVEKLPGKKEQLHKAILNAKNHKRFRRDADSEWSELWSRIYPGTKWCGAGNISDNYYDLGSLASVDSCCRQHDHCPDSIPSFDTRSPEYGGLFNFNIFYTKTHCSCDEEFRNCLKNSDDGDEGGFVGWLFYDVFGIDCFWRHEPFGCVDRAWWGWCYEYGFQCSQSPVWEFYDQPGYDEDFPGAAEC